MVHSRFDFLEGASHAGGSIDRSKKLVVAALIAQQLLSVGTHLIGKSTLNAIGPLSTALLRFLTASAAFLVILLLRGERSRIARADIPKILWLGLLAVPLNQSCFLFGLAQSTASHASLLYALTPLCVLLIARKVLHEENAGAKLFGVLVAFAGTIFIFLDRGLAREMSMMRGDILLLLAVIAWAVYTTSSKELLVRYDPITLTGWSIITGTAMMLPGAFLPGAIPPLAAMTPAVWGGILYLAVGTSVIAYALWSYALRRIDASKVAVTTNAQPVLTSVASYFLFHERFGPAFFAGAALILFGVTWVETRGK